METKEIVAELEELARSSEDAAVSYPRNEEHFIHTAKALREAIVRLSTNQDNQPRWRTKKEKPEKKGRYEVVCRNGDIPPYVLLGFYNPDNPGWDLYGVTHWRPLPEPPKEE